MPDTTKPPLDPAAARAKIIAGSLDRLTAAGDGLMREAATREGLPDDVVAGKLNAAADMRVYADHVRSGLIDYSHTKVEQLIRAGDGGITTFNATTSQPRIAALEALARDGMMVRVTEPTDPSRGFYALTRYGGWHAENRPADPPQILTDPGVQHRPIPVGDDPRVTVHPGPDGGTPSYTVRTDTGPYTITHHPADGWLVQPARAEGDAPLPGYAMGITEPDRGEKVVSALLNADEHTREVYDELMLRADTNGIRGQEKWETCDDIAAAAKEHITPVAQPDPDTDSRVGRLRSEDLTFVRTENFGTMHVKPDGDGYRMYHVDHHNHDGTEELSVASEVHPQADDLVVDLLAADMACTRARVLTAGAASLEEDLQELPEETTGTYLHLDQVPDTMAVEAAMLRQMADRKLDILTPAAKAAIVHEDQTVAQLNAAQTELFNTVYRQARETGQTYEEVLDAADVTGNDRHHVEFALSGHEPEDAFEDIDDDDGADDDGEADEPPFQPDGDEEPTAVLTAQPDIDIDADVHVDGDHRI